LTIPRPKAQKSRRYGGKPMAILWWIIVGLVAGWATGKIMGGTGYGFIMDIVVGIVGAVIGGFVMTRLGLAASGGMVYTIIVAIFGAIILTLIVRLVTGKKPRLVPRHE
jgi:uncharacterized membrane protein YeaQ/YmgE (transglycosylase-associated protein family)